MKDPFGLEGKRVLVTGLANRKSVAYFIGRALEEVGAEPVYSVRTAERADSVQGLTGDRDVLVCDVSKQEEIDALAAAVAERHGTIHGLVHSLAYADYTDGWRPFHETGREQFLQAVDISCFSLMALSRALLPTMDPDGSVVTIGISTTTMAAENYGYMAPVKAALDSAVAFLAKSLASAGTRIRCNAVRAGMLKTASSAGIPGYLDSYLHAEAATLRHEAVKTREVADTALFLLSPRSSGINATGIVVDAGMAVNYFDHEIVRKVTGAPER